MMGRKKLHNKFGADLTKGQIGEFDAEGLLALFYQISLLNTHLSNKMFMFSSEDFY
jgi:hypothetical protein